jgi:hypothetical protein
MMNTTKKNNRGEGQGEKRKTTRINGERGGGGRRGEEEE